LGPQCLSACRLRRKRHPYRFHPIRLLATRQDAIFVQHLGRNLGFMALARDPLAKYLGGSAELGGR
jgi:hypothetical protein